jgi:hypothetical protein
MLSAHALLLLVSAASFVNDGVATQYLQERGRHAQQKLSTLSEQ